MHDKLDSRTTARHASRAPAGAKRHAPVSVVIPCYRCAGTIGDALASVAAQTLPPAEVLMVEDCSGDGTLDALRRLASAYPPGWVRVLALDGNGGPSRARNVGWEQATQPWIAFLDADDTWGARKLELQMAALEADPEIALLGHRMVVRARGTPVPEVAGPVRTRIVGRRTMLLHNPFPTASVVLRRDLPFRFDEAFRRSEDFLLWAQVLLSGHRCARIEHVLAIWNRRAAGSTGLSDDFAAMRATNDAARRRLMQQGLISRAEFELTRIASALRWARRDMTLRIRRQGPYRPEVA